MHGSQEDSINRKNGPSTDRPTGVRSNTWTIIRSEQQKTRREVRGETRSATRLLLLAPDDGPRIGPNTGRAIPTPNAKIYTGVPTIEHGEDRHEKPWQRVPSALLILLLGTYFLLAYLTQLVEDDMPRVVQENDIARDDFSTFSEEAAWRYLDIILGDGPRVAGTKYHLRKTQDLKNLLDTVAGQGNIPVRTDWQLADDDYWLEFSPPYVNVFKNVSNIIALLEGESGFHSNGTIGTTLLVNCHYDSVPYATGASDDGVFCAVMMEVLSKLSRRGQRLKHNVVFLFNGAEENSLQGAYPFLKHPWAAGITNVINLDAAGMNGKPFIFQVTDTRVLSAYKSVTTRPAGQSVGEFLFRTGIIPSDTDFRVWRDFGNFHGVDIAFVKWGHVYHTRYDHPDMIHPGVIQNAGDMLLRTVEATANMEELDTQIEPSAAVYYDYLYWFMVTYSLRAAVAVDVCVALCGVASVAGYVWLVGFRRSTITELLWAALGRAACLVAGILACTVLTSIMVATNMQLRYLSQPWVVVPHYWMPFIITAVCVSHLFDAWRCKKSGLNRSVRALQAMAATRLLLATLLLIFSCVPSLTTLRYLITVPLFIMSIFSVFSLAAVAHIRGLRAWHHLLMEFLFSLPSSMFLISLVLRFNSIMMPIMGRSSTNTPDVTIAIINVGLAVIVTSTVSGVELLFSRRRLWVAASALAVASFVLMFVPFSPYQDDGPSTQRHYWFHSEIVSHDINSQVTERTSGVLVTKHDAFTTDSALRALRNSGIRLDVRSDWADQCEARVFCNLPIYRLRFGMYLGDSVFLSTGPPAPFTPTPSVRATKTCTGERCTFRFVMTGPAHNTLTLWPRANVTAVSWSFASSLRPSLHQGGRPVYAVIHAYPTYSEPFVPTEFTVDFVVPLALQSQPAVDLSHHAFKANHPEDYTQEYRSLVEAVPKYFNIATFLSFRYNYVF